VLKYSVWKIVYKQAAPPPPTPPKEGRDKWGNDLKTKSDNMQSVYSANLYLLGTPLLWRGWERSPFIIILRHLFGTPLLWRGRGRSLSYILKRLLKHYTFSYF